MTWLRGLTERQVIDCMSPDATRRIIDAVARFWP
jgi:hypothetical protein